MGSFFSTAILDDDARNKRGAAQMQVGERDKRSAGKVRDGALARWKRIRRTWK
jgi:hypothetical protein